MDVPELPILSMMPPGSDIATCRLETTPAGISTLVVKTGEKEVYLHSKKNPLRDHDIARKREQLPDNSLVIVMGTGLGYHLQPLMENKSAAFIVAIDPLECLESLTNEVPSLAELNQDPRCILLTGKKAFDAPTHVAQIISDNDISTVTTIEHPASIRLFPEFYQDIAAQISTEIEHSVSRNATIRHMGNLFLSNGLKKLSEIQNLVPVKELFNRFSNVPALVCSSGPGLDQVLDSIPRDHNLLIIAVDSALSSCLARNIMPHLVVSIDPQPWIREHLLCLPQDGPPVVTSLTGYFDITRDKIPTYLSLNSHPLSQIVEHLFPGEMGTINSATGSVTGDALVLAMEMGCNPVCLAGQDFSFPGFTIYARETAYQSRYRSFFQTRTSTVESRNLDYIMKSSNACKVEGHYTRKSFQVYRQALENLVAEYNGTSTVYNTGNGLPLNGIDHVSLQDLSSLIKPGQLPPVLHKARENTIQAQRIRDFLLQEEVLRELCQESGNNAESTCRDKIIHATRRMEIS